MNRRFVLTVAYDGTDFAGWQRQAAGKGYSVQQTLEEALAEVLGVETRIHGAGRTDAGVHALGQCCHFESDKPLPLVKLPQIINHQLPHSVRVLKARAEDESFHARFSATGKHYRYVIERGAADSPFTGRYSWQLAGDLDISAMSRAAEPLLGEHDFRHFTVRGVSAVDFTRHLHKLTVSEGAEICANAAMPPMPWQELTRPVIIDAEGSGFLYKMMRIIVARLVVIGRGGLDSGAMSGFLSGSVQKNIPPAPPQGLMLMDVSYD